MGDRFWAILCQLHAQGSQWMGCGLLPAPGESRPPGGGLRHSQAGRGRRVLLGSTWASCLSTVG